MSLQINYKKQLILSLSSDKYFTVTLALDILTSKSIEGTY
jgi:hypothetical protein